MLNAIYTLIFIMSLLLLIVMVVRYGNRVSSYYIMLFTAVMISCFGAMQLTSATEMRTAIYANQTIYLGACNCPLFLLLCIADLCKVQVKKMHITILSVSSVFIFCLVSSVGVTGLYYKSLVLGSKYGISILVKENGPLHILWPIYLLSICVICINMIVDAMKRRKEVPYSTSVMLFMCLLFPVSVYIIGKIVIPELEIMPFAYIIAQTVCILLVRRIRLYEVSAISSMAMLDSDNQGFILCNDKGRYLGSDESAKEWFPEINELYVDKVMNCEGSKLLTQLQKWLNKEADSEVVYIETGDRIIEVSHTILRERKSNSVHCFYLEDETEQQNYTRLIKEYNDNLERDVALKTQKLRKVQNDIIISMASIVENRDSNTGGHIARTSDIIKIFVEYLQKQNRLSELTKEVAERIIKAAPLHDFGKIGIPDVVLNKPGKFTDEEYEIMKQHSAKGAVIVEQILRHSDDELFKRIAINVAHYHHEKWDGRGYPDKLSGTDIPFEARVMALADVFDALVSKRVYKDSFSYDKAFDIIRESKGNHFDPVLCEAFLECRPQLEELYNSYTD